MYDWFDPEEGAFKGDHARPAGKQPHRPRRPRRGGLDRTTILAGALMVVPVLVGIGLIVLLITRPEPGARPAPTPTLIDLEAVVTETAVARLAELAVSVTPTPSTTPAPATATPTPTLPPPTATQPIIASVTVPPFDAFGTATPQGGVNIAADGITFNQIVYVCYIEGIDELCVMNPDGSNQRQITQRGITSFYPSWHPDGTKIIFSSQADGNFELFTIRPDGTGLQRLTYTYEVDEYAPDYSPDGLRVVYASTAGGLQNIWVMNADGSGQQQLTFDDAEDLDPSWSPDGAQISFASTRGGTKDVYVMSATGGNVRRITYGMSIGGRNDWSPDGRFLTFYRGAVSDKNVYLVSTACADPAAPLDCRSAPVRLTTGGNNKGPSFSPDGQWVAFAANRGDDNDIYIIRIDGTNLRQLTFETYAEWQPRWQP